MADEIKIRKRRLFKFSVDLFISLLKQVTKRKDIPYRCNDADIVSWNNLVETFGEGIGEEFMKEFILYGINSWFNEDTRTDCSKTIRFNWCVGAAAIKRWNALPGRARTYYVRKSLKTQHKITTTKHECRLSELLIKIRPAEEKFKQEFHNTRRGLAWCVANTSLYNHKSGWCVTCTNKETCKQTLKNEFSRVYKIRGYGEK